MALVVAVFGVHDVGMTLTLRNFIVRLQSASQV
jgi:hypothetical protein